MSKKLKYDALVIGEWEFRASNERLGERTYHGFAPFQPQWVGKSKYLAVLIAGNEFSLWHCRDEKGREDLQEFYRQFEGIEPDCFLFSPECLYSGEWMAECYKTKGG